MTGFVTIIEAVSGLTNGMRGSLLQRGSCMELDPILVSVSHSLGEEEATRRIKAAVADAEITHSSLFKVAEENWENSHAQFRVNLLGLPCTGKISVDDRQASLEFRLSWYLGHITETARSYIQQTANRVLAG
jgi:hypothetical protein